MSFNLKTSKISLVFHIFFSVGWVGAVTVFIILAFIGMTTQDEQVLRSTLISMAICTRFVIVPFSFVSLVSGFIQSLVTNLCLLKYYWIILKLIITIVMIGLLILHLEPINFLESLATSPNKITLNESELVFNLLLKSIAACIGLFLLTIISIFRPWGKIQLKKNNINTYLLVGLICILVIFITLHIVGGDFGGH